MIVNRSHLNLNANGARPTEEDGDVEAQAAAPVQFRLEVLRNTSSIDLDSTHRHFEASDRRLGKSTTLDV
jgi:hypothetical protein